MLRKGYGQVEPNHLSAQRTGQIYAQLPAADTIKVLENGEFVKYDYENGEVNKTGEGEWMLVFNEVKLYDGYRETYKDFAQKVSDSADGKIYPRVFKTNVGDIYTTNMLEKASEGETTLTDLEVGDDLGINEDGYLEKDENSDIKFKVVKVYTMADGQPAVKVQRIA
jgi:glutathionylspermidine synthase